MKLRIEVDGEEYSLDIKPDGAECHYDLRGVTAASGTASVVPAGLGVFSVLLNTKSFRVYIVQTGDVLDVRVNGRHYVIGVADRRDSWSVKKKSTAAGPVEIRAQMPGKIISLLVQSGSRVQAGQGVIVVEAMKMQNEMKSPKDGVVSQIRVTEGATIAPGETLVVIE